MYFDDHKKAIATMMEKRKSGEVIKFPLRPEIAKDEDGAVDGFHAAAEDIIGAFHEKSAHKMKAALSNFMDMHNSKQKDESASD